MIINKIGNYELKKDKWYLNLDILYTEVNEKSHIRILNRVNKLFFSDLILRKSILKLKPETASSLYEINIINEKLRSLN